MTILKRDAAHHTTPIEAAALGSAHYQGKRYIIVPSSSKATPHYVEIDAGGAVLCCDERCEDWNYRGKERGEPCRHMKAAESLLSGEQERRKERTLLVLLGIAACSDYRDDTLIFYNPDGKHGARHYLDEAQYILHEEGWI